MRLAAAIAVIAVAFSAAVYIHQRHTLSIGTYSGPGSAYRRDKTTLSIRRHPSWEDPAAVLIAIGGIAVAVGIVAYRNPRFAKPS